MIFERWQISSLSEDFFKSGALSVSVESIFEVRNQESIVQINGVDRYALVM